MILVKTKKNFEKIKNKVQSLSIKWKKNDCTLLDLLLLVIIDSTMGIQKIKLYSTLSVLYSSIKIILKFDANIL